MHRLNKSDQPVPPMSYPQIQTKWTEFMDYSCTLFKQKNSCPICHLPLVYNYPVTNSDGSPEQSPDLYYTHMRDIMKAGVAQSSNLFGVEPTACNSELCHYVSSTMVPELTKPRLFETPAAPAPGHQVHVLPEDGLYLLPTEPRTKDEHQIFKYDLAAMFVHGITEPRLMRLNGYLSTMGTRWFLACKDCNMAHTGHDQLSLMMEELYNFKTSFGTTPDGNPIRPRNIYNMYTILFDLMREYGDPRGPAYILADEKRCKHWQIEVWLNYCTVMFVAQHVKRANNSKYKGNDVWGYQFHHAHRDVGMCDFYMSQILCVYLYGNFDIDVDFVWLHQNVLALLPIWATEMQLFHTPKHGYRSLYRLVLGAEAEKTNWLPIKTDLAYHPPADPASPSTYTLGDSNVYWVSCAGALTTRCHTMVKSIEDFMQKWLRPLGTAMSTNWKDHDAVQFGERAAAVQHFRNYYYSRCNSDVYKHFRALSVFSRQSSDEDYEYNYSYMNHYQSMTAFLNIVKDIDAAQYRSTLYHNMVWLAFARMRVAYSMVCGRNLSAPVNAIIIRKWPQMVWALENLVNVPL